jgi:Gpi18-like mannosyltransferase
MKRPVIIAIAVATIVKLLLAWFTIGTSDVATWRAFANNAALCGQCVYSLPGPYGDPFNHPPFIILFLKLIAGTALFPFWLRLPSILADIATVFFVSRLLPNASKWLLVLLALNPVSILISGFHGNTDPVMICFVVASIYAATKNRFELAGVALGMALNIKIVPLLFAPSFLFQPGMRRRLIFIATAVVTVLVFLLPYMSKEVITNVLRYRGLFVNWGPAHYLDLTGRAPFYFLAAPMRYAIIIGSIVLSSCLNRKGRSLFEICAAIVLLFYVFTPSIAMQYFAWGVPFVILLGRFRASLYYAFAGALIALQYHRWSNGTWYFADSHSVPPVTAQTEFLSFAVWAICIFLLYRLCLKSRTPCLGRVSTGSGSDLVR